MKTQEQIINEALAFGLSSVLAVLAVTTLLAVGSL
jgi:hypothetical protein